MSNNKNKNNIKNRDDLLEVLLEDFKDISDILNYGDEITSYFITINFKDENKPTIIAQDAITNNNWKLLLANLELFVTDIKNKILLYSSISRDVIKEQLQQEEEFNSTSKNKESKNTSIKFKHKKNIH